MIGDVDPQHVVVRGLSPSVFRGRDNVTAVQLAAYTQPGQRNTPLDLVGSSRMILVLPEADPVIAFDSGVDADVLDWSQGMGRLEIDVAQYAIPIGVYRCQLVVYDSAHPRGQVVVSDQAPHNRLELVVSEVLTTSLTPPPPLPPTEIGDLISEDPGNTLVLGADGKLYVPGSEGGAGVVVYAGMQVSALKVVYELNDQVFYLDHTDEDHIDLIFGVTITSASAGATVRVQRSGELEDSGWSWTPGRVWLGANGTLTQTPPADGFDVLIGAATSATRIALNIQDPIGLEI